MTRVRKILSDHRKRLLPGLVALSLLAGLITSIVLTPSAQADYANGCGYGYGSDGLSYGYGTGTGYGYGYGHDGTFSYGYGNQVGPGDQVCSSTTTTTTSTTTTTTPTTTTTSGGGVFATTTVPVTTTTTTVPVTTTTGAVTTTTTAPRPKVCNLHATKFHGFAVVGRGMTRAITGACFYAQPRITSNEFGTRVGVFHDNGRVLVVRVTVRAGSKPGWHTLTIREPNGKQCKVNYLVRIIPR
jgi:hypothetical protein